LGPSIEHQSTCPALGLVPLGYLNSRRLFYSAFIAYYESWLFAAFLLDRAG